MKQDEFDRITPNNRDWYGPGFFKFTELDHGWSNVLFGHVLWLVFRPSSVIELGCGTGATLAALRRCGVEVLGVDGFADCIPFIARHDPEVASQVVIHDLGTPWTAPKQFDLAVSIETLEHIAPEGADHAVKTICDAAPVAVVTACPPVGRNPLHLNEQPFPYWVEKFAAQGKVLDPVATNAVRDVMRAFYRLHEAKQYPVIPAWYFSDYFGVFRSA